MTLGRIRSFLRALACGGVSLIAAAVAWPQTITPSSPDGQPHRFEMRDEKFSLDDEPMLIVAGEMHFGRVLPEDWELRIKQARAMGLNTVSFYLFWNLCEPREGEFSFTGMTDVRRMLQLCQENGLWVILRPGPYCCAEVEYGGIPWWTAKYPDVPIRTNDPTYVAWSRRYIEQVFRQVGGFQVTRGGPLLMVQMENEYGMVGRGNNEYLQSLQTIFRDVGFDVPLFTCDPILFPPRDPAQVVPGVLRGRNGLRNERALEQTRNVIGDQPVFVPELYTAWFSGWGQPIATRFSATEDVVAWTSFLLQNDASFCYYMFHGGTTFGFFNGCNEYLPVQTSYDYRAPVDEAGRTTAKYRALRELLTKYRDGEPPPVPPDPKVVALPAIQLTDSAALLDMLPGEPTLQAAHPVSMEDLNQDYGFVLYRKRFPDGVHGTLKLRDARDYTIVMVNGRTVGEAFVGLGLDSNKLDLDETGPVTLDLLVYNLGRISVITSAATQGRARKGLVGGATLEGVELLDWEMFSLPFASVTKLKPSSTPPSGPTFHHGTFDISEPAGTFLDLRPWSFGVVWVNGHNLGRYWNRGGLRSLFLPAPWQKAGRNDIVILELQDAPSSPEVTGTTNLIEEPPAPFPVRLDRRKLEPNPTATPASS